VESIDTDRSMMSDRRIIFMMKKIDRYIRGELDQGEIDQLWIEILKEPEWLEILEMDVLLRMDIKNPEIP